VAARHRGPSRTGLLLVKIALAFLAGRTIGFRLQVSRKEVSELVCAGRATVADAVVVILSKRRAAGKGETGTEFRGRARRPEFTHANALIGTTAATGKGDSMPHPDRLLPTLHRAAGHFRATSGRTGRLVRLADAADVLVAGDLHGHLDNFRRVLQLADLAAHPRRHLVLQEVIHGTFRYLHGGDKSHQLLDLIAALTCQFPGRVHFLLGNHELSQWTERPIAKNDLDLNVLFREGVEQAYGDRADEVYRAYLTLFAAAPLAVRTPNRVFLSHSLPSARRAAAFDPALLERDDLAETDLLYGGGVHALVWGRDTSAANAAEFLRRVDADFLISGHIPCDHGFEAPNAQQLILDSQASPACYCLFPADRPLSHAELLGCVANL
jgi:hypothetical protein